MRKLTLFKYSAISILTTLQASCVLTSFNTGSAESIQRAANYKLPTTPSKDNSVVYLAHPYFIMGAAIPVLDATVPAHSNYCGSAVVVTQAGQSQKSYIGALWPDTTLCFVAPPGTYMVDIVSPGGAPPQISRPISLKAGTTQMYGITSKMLAAPTSQMSFAPLSLAKGKYYVQKSPPALCKSLQTLAAETTIYNINFNVVNHTDKPFIILGSSVASDLNRANNDARQHGNISSATGCASALDGTVTLSPNATATFSHTIITNKLEEQFIVIREPEKIFHLPNRAVLSLKHIDDNALTLSSTFFSDRPPVGLPTSTCTHHQQGQTYNIDCKVILNKEK